MDPVVLSIATLVLGIPASHYGSKLLTQVESWYRSLKDHESKVAKLEDSRWETLDNNAPAWPAAAGVLAVAAVRSAVGLFTSLPILVLGTALLASALKSEKIVALTSAFPWLRGALVVVGALLYLSGTLGYLLSLRNLRGLSNRARLLWHVATREAVGIKEGECVSCGGPMHKPPENAPFEPTA